MASNLAFGLTTPVDFLEKARREIARITNSPIVVRGGFDAKFESADSAINAAITLWHITDWLARSDDSRSIAIIRFARHETGKATGDPYAVLKHYVVRNPDIALCHDICNGIKHLELDRPVTPITHFDLDTGKSVDLHSDVSAGSVATVAPIRNLHTVTSAPVYEDQRWVPKIIMPINQSRVPVVEVYKRAVGYWEQLFREHGLIP